MISIIVASTNQFLLSNLKENIEKTIGVPYEIISFDNKNGRKGLCRIYNEGAAKAKFEVVCFSHEDIEFKTFNWGKIVEDVFKINEKIGLLGVAGASYKSRSPSGWFCFNGLKKVHYANIIQDFKHKEKESIHTYVNETDIKLANVAVLDGVWLCAKKSVVLQHPFDDNIFNGFHCYDLDISLSIGQYYKVAVTFEILINHFSEGTYTKDWINDTLLLHKKWRHILPVNNAGLTQRELLFCEKKSMRYFINKMQQFNIPPLERLSILWQTKLYESVGWKLFLKLNIDLFKHRDDFNE